jgi:hypothetical protein
LSRSKPGSWPTTQAGQLAGSSTTAGPWWAYPSRISARDGPSGSRPAPGLPW